MFTIANCLVVAALEPGHLNVTRVPVTRDRYWPGDPPGPGRSCV